MHQEYNQEQAVAYAVMPEDVAQGVSALTALDSFAKMQESWVSLSENP